MKPVHVVILILAGALGGAGLMKVVQPRKPATAVRAAVAELTPLPEPAPPVAAIPEPEPVPVPAPAPATAEPVAAPETAPLPVRSKPSPMPLPVKREVAPRHAPPVATQTSDAVTVPGLAPAPPVAVAQVTPPVPSTPSPTMAPPSASTEPEHETPASPQASVAPVPQPHQVTLNAGLLLPVRLVDGLSSERNAPGDAFLATLDRELVVDGFVIAERGARVEGQVIAADRSGPARGAALALALTRLHTSDGQLVAIQTEDYFRHAESASGDKNAAKIGGGAVIGAVIGAIAGGGKGAAIGVGVGGAAGAGDVLLTHGKPAELPSESRVTFRLKMPVPLTEQLR